MNELWNTLAARGNLTLDAGQHDKLGRYLDLLAAANETMNLTRITDRHAAGIPLAIARPELDVWLVEATKKKAAFLEKTAAELGLGNVHVLALRAEEVGQFEHREAFDVAAARAVATLDWLAEWCLPLLKLKGKMLAMKGKRAAEELPAATIAIRLLGGGKPIVHPIELPDTDSHVVIEIGKQQRTDLKYPRPPTSAKGRAIGAAGKEK